uniref:Reticulocyte-binding protein 2 homolog a n=1 Tax=Cacopsylla melanoneura TaxID=428564 RepID=A0A8D8RWQ7_9HEMI
MIEEQEKILQQELERQRELEKQKMEQKRQEEMRRIEEQKRQEEMRRIEEQKRQDEMRRLEEQKRKEQEQARLLEEQKRQQQLEEERKMLQQFEEKQKQKLFEHQKSIFSQDLDLNMDKNQELPFSNQTQGQYPGYGAQCMLDKTPGTEKLDQNNMAQSDERWVPPSTYDPIPSPYTDLHGRNKWADSVVMPSRRSSTSSSISEEEHNESNEPKHNQNQNQPNSNQNNAFFPHCAMPDNVPFHPYSEASQFVNPVATLFTGAPPSAMFPGSQFSTPYSMGLGPNNAMYYQQYTGLNQTMHAMSQQQQGQAMRHQLHNSLPHQAHQPPSSLPHQPPTSISHPPSLSHQPPSSLPHKPPTSVSHQPPTSVSHQPPTSVSHSSPPWDRRIMMMLPTLSQIRHFS